MQLIIIIFYFVIIVTIGLAANKKTKSASSFHGAGLGVLMCVAAGTGEWLGGTSTTGVSEYGFDFGISGAWYTIANGIGIIFLAIFFAKLYRSLETVTVPGIIEKFIGVKARVISSILLTFVMIAVGTSQVVAAGTLGVSVFHLDYVSAVIALGLVFIGYTLAGGMTAVGYTNTIHLIAMYGGALLALFLVVGDVGGFSQMRLDLPPSYFSMTAIGTPKVISWIIASLLGACTAQAGIQPILAARDVTVAKKAAFITALAVAPFGIITALLGMAAKIKFPGLSNGKQALPTLMMNVNPVAGGIILASILAAILSTISPIILASGTMITKDIYQRILRPNATDAQVLRMSRITTAVAGLLCIITAIILYDSSRLLDIVYFAYTLRGCMFVVLLLGIYWKRTS
ncbi:MAG: sodium:solute symporter family protein, partial [Treponema sp.]|nr:sodium:solute symporter family protein [Treponema sp.]